MPIQFISRAKVNLVGELAEAPVFLQTGSGSPMAKIKIQTTEHFMSKGERKVRREIHDVTVFNKLGVDLLKSFGKPGVHFLIDGKLTNKIIEVSQYGGEIFVMTTGESGDAAPAAGNPQARSGNTSTQQQSSSGAKPSGGLGRIGSRAASQPERDLDDEGGRPQSYRSDADLDDDIPF